MAVVRDLGKAPGVAARRDRKIAAVLRCSSE